MNIFLKVLKIETVLFECALIVFTIFSCLFVKEIQNEVPVYFRISKFVQSKQKLHIDFSLELSRIKI